jgi:hypothetical protein
MLTIALLQAKGGSVVQIFDQHIFYIKYLSILHKYLGVWYKWGEDTTDRYLEASVEDFVTVTIEDFKTSLKKLPCTAMTPALPGTILRNNDGNTILHKEFRSMVGKLLYL